MKVCVVGTGAIGGFLGVRLAHAGHDISLIARGPHLAAIQSNGLKLIQDGEQLIANNVVATSNISELSAQDVVIMALKAHQIAAIVDKLPHLFGKDTVVVTVQNGIPWWYFQNMGQNLSREYANRTVETVDPGGVLKSAIDAHRILGCIAYPAMVIVEPGVIQHIEGVRFPVGELDGADSARVNRISEMFIEAGFKSPVLPDIRSEIWLKLWGNLSFNPISAVTHATLEAICQYPLTRELAASMMLEAQAVAEKLGASFRVTVERRIEGAEKVGKHKTSMLQDVESGKPLEIDGMLGAVIELAEVTATDVPALKSIYACVCLLNKTIADEQVSIKGWPRQ
ncbi:2-dehydropantoate 2-reductase [Candidatus Spongiihabitans sp.]|uniref:2-dehydropantoate 2-reductase n=1 Tax=Candidatus Spongiihabitans sp. TaxID=3101308 RepID=UPI003C701452